MADINININSNVGEQINSVTALKKAYREAMNEAASGTEGASKRAADLKDRLEDLNDATKSLKGSGVEKLTASMGLLRDGFANADPGKLGTALKGLGSAMSAIPIFLVIEGIQYLVQNFDKLKDSSGLLGKAFSAIGDVIGWVVQKFKDLTDWLGLTNNAVEDNAQKTIDASKKIGAAQQERYDNEIKLAKAAGKETYDMEVKKQQAIIATSAEQLRALAQFSSLTEEQKKDQQELYKKINDAVVESKVLTLTKAKETTDKLKEELAKRKKDIEDFRNEALGEQKTYWENRTKEETAIIEENNAKWKAAGELSMNISQANADKSLEIRKKRYEDELALAEAAVVKDGATYKEKQALLQAQMNEELTRTELTESEKLKIRTKYEEATRKLKEDTLMQGLQTEQTVQGKVQNLANAYFQFKMQNLSKDSAEYKKYAKQQFEVNKAFGIATTTVNAAMAVVKDLKDYAYPYNLIVAGIDAAAAAVQIAAISSQEFNPGSTSSGGVTPPTGGSTNVDFTTSAPSAPAFDIFNSTGGGQGNNLNQTHVIKAVVVSQEITDRQTQNAYSQNMGSL